MNLKTHFNVGNYVQVANVGTGKILSILKNISGGKDGFLILNLHNNSENIIKSKTHITRIEYDKILKDLHFFGALERRGLPIPQTEIYLYNPFFDTSPMFNKKTGKRTIPKNTPKRHDYFWADKQVSLEIDGGTFGGKSGHNTGVGIGKGMDKTNWCAHYGIRLLRFTPQELFSDLLFKHLTHLLK